VFATFALLLALAPGPRAVAQFGAALAPNVWVWWQFKDCRTMDQAAQVVDYHVHFGRTRLLLAGIPAGVFTKADSVLYVALGIYSLGFRWRPADVDEATKLRRAIGEELMRRPSLSDNLVEAALAVPNPGPFANHPRDSVAESMVQRCADLYKDRVEDPKQQMAPWAHLATLAQETV
jgi:hypothetical protein